MFNADMIKEKIKPLFKDFYDSVLFSYFDGIFGTAYCDNLQEPECAVIKSGDFFFIAGKISCGEDIMALIGNNRWAVVVPDKAEWLDELNRFDKKLLRVDRFHTTLPENGFNVENLQERCDRILQHKDMSLVAINEVYYYKALENDWSKPFVENFENYDDFGKNAFGFVIVKNDKIISGTSTYSFYKRGVEIEVATDVDYRLMGLATICASRFLLECTKRNLTPHWDARNETSLNIAKKMGFVFKDKYTAFEFDQSQF